MKQMVNHDRYLATLQTEDRALSALDLSLASSVRVSGSLAVSFASVIFIAAITSVSVNSAQKR
jgi:hypothetical protein